MYETKPAGEHRMGDGAECARWYAIRTRSASEQLVADGLTARQIEHYLPTRLVMHHGRIVVAKLFPGYLFARIAGRTMAPILEVPGVVQVVGRGAAPESISDAEVEAIRQIASITPTAQILPKLISGTRVRIRTFELEGFEGVVAKVDGRDVVAVNVSILGRSIVVDIAAHDLEIMAGSVNSKTAGDAGFAMEGVFAW